MIVQQRCDTAMHDRWRKWERAIRMAFIWAVFFVIVAFYIPVVSAIQGLLKVSFNNHILKFIAMLSQILPIETRRSLPLSTTMRYTA